MYIDSIMILILAYSIFSSYKRGFVLSLKTFLMLSLGVIISYILANHISSLIVSDKNLSFYIIFIIVFIICIQVARILLKKLEVFLIDTLKKSDLIWVNSLLGALIGFLKVSIIVFIIVSIIGAFQIKPMMKAISQTTVTSSLYSMVRKLTGYNLMKSLRSLSSNPKLKTNANARLKKDSATPRKENSYKP